MMTIALAIIHAFSTNSEFHPTVLYIGTFLIDMAIVDIIL